MALADKLKSLFKQGQGAVASNKDKAHQAVDKVADEADRRTHGKYSDKIDKAQQKADEAVDNMQEPGGGSGGAADRPAAAGSAGAPIEPGGTGGSAGTMTEPGGAGGNADTLGEPGGTGGSAGGGGTAG